MLDAQPNERRVEDTGPRSQQSPSWRPILAGAEREAALAAALDIAQALRERSAPAQAGAEYPEGEVLPAGLAGGQAGLALLFAYLARALPDPRDEASAARCMEGAVEALAHCPMPPSLYGGFPGIAWAA